MTVTHRKRQYQPEEITTVNEPGTQFECDSCHCDLTHSVRIKCANPVCEVGEGIDICPNCFCSGKEFGKHKRWHAYRVIELHSYPIFSEDWGADEELLLLEGISLQGLGNWQAIAEHVGTRTKEEVETHYESVYIKSPNWPLPRMDLHFDVDPAEFHERKRRRIATMNSNPPPAPKLAPTSAPGVHEVAGFLPGRLEFEHELDNEAEDLVKDLEFGVCYEWGGGEIVEDENDPDVRARARWEEEQKAKDATPGKRPPNGPLNVPNGVPNGRHTNGGTPSRDVQGKSEGGGKTANGDMDGDAEVEEVTQPPPVETPESLSFKLSLIEMYNQRVDKRHEAKAFKFNRGLLNYKQMQAADKKRPKEEKDIIHRLRPFARLQTAEDFEVFCADILYEALLRKRIQELQHYRRMGLTTVADIDKYESDVIKRVRPSLVSLPTTAHLPSLQNQAKAGLSRDYFSSERLALRAGGGRQSLGPDSRERERGKSHELETTPKPMPAASGTGPPGRKMPAPLNLANSPSLHLLTPEEQTLCSQLRILPKPYLVIKETLVREYARRGGKLRRREARDLVKIDVNKTSRVWDFLVQAGFLKVGSSDLCGVVPAWTLAGSDTGLVCSRPSATPTLSASPSKDSQMYGPAPRPSPFTSAPLSNGTVLPPSTSVQSTGSGTS
ncbi:SWIRM-domain-containing protein [Laetiporus sulphureus 93-53]|uniref:SWIRM-domain-containing protein n=1 Tax=Laetiporus sulphureus 93-53 TaxID=1314785 RepID=A0A165GWF8_9APHY|nr:SWIRM-domain-containing protein [Laetiporus sulphureus 93-53]KZT10919.1 SWIRM-domain-containing protein [Laetiporus sulphureus 93-53]